MNQYQILVNNVRDQKLKFYFILSVPRSNSTTLQLALSQASEIDKQINLPFNNEKALESQNTNFKNTIPVNTISQRINFVVENLIQSGKKTRVVIHEHFDFLKSDEHLSLLKDLSTDFIFCFRYPKIQFLSYILVFMNHIFLTDNSLVNKNLFTYEDLFLLLKAFKNSDINFDNTMNKLLQEKSIKIHTIEELKKCLIADGMFKENEQKLLTSFHLRSIFSIFLDECKEHLEYSWNRVQYTLDFFKDSSINMIMVDADLFIKNPTQTLIRITEQLGDISFSPDMVDNWNKFTGKNFVCCISDTLSLRHQNIWNGESQNSTKIQPYNDTRNNYIASQSELLDDKFQIILTKALETYGQVNHIKL